MLAGLSMSLFISLITVRVVGILCYVFLLIRIPVGESLPEIDEVRVELGELLKPSMAHAKLCLHPLTLQFLLGLFHRVRDNNSMLACPERSDSHPFSCFQCPPNAAAPIIPAPAAPVSAPPPPRIREARPTVDLDSALL